MLIWDNHACMPIRPEDPSFLPQLQRVREAGVNIISLNIGYGPHSVESHFRMLAQFRNWVEVNSDHYRLGQSIEDVRSSEQDGRLTIFFDIEGGGAIDDQISLVKLYYDLGVRWMLIAYNKNNLIGGGCYDDDLGLTALGRDVVAEMNRVGMVVCCSHTGERSVRDAIDTSADPVIFSHSNCKAIFDHARNVSDSLIRACAARGGVIGINGIGPFLGRELATADMLVRHIDHIAQMVGVDHVGLGLDYVFDQAELEDAFVQFKDTFPEVPERLSFVGPEQIGDIKEQLDRRGYNREALTKIMGGNWLRIAESVWK